MVFINNCNLKISKFKKLKNVIIAKYFINLGLYIPKNNIM